MLLNLDTHIWIDLLAGNLSPSERKKIESSEVSISSIVLWEMAKLVQLKRLEVDLESREFKMALTQITIWPITREIAIQSTQLDIKSDPADEIISATSIVHEVPLLTRDKLLLKSKKIPLAFKF